MVMMVHRCEAVHHTKAVILFHKQPTYFPPLFSLHAGMYVHTYMSPSPPHFIQVSHIRNASRFLHAGASNGQRQQDTEYSAWWVGSLCFVTSFNARAALTSQTQSLLYSKCVQ